MRRHDDAVTLGRRLRDAPSLAHSLFIYAVSQTAGGDAAAVLAIATELRELSVRHRFLQFEACALMFLGWTLARSGETERGIAQMRDGFGILRRQGPRAVMTLAHWLMADAHLMAHHYREGLELAQPLDFAETSDSSWLARLHHLRAELLLHLHGLDDEAVEANLRQAISVARQQGAKGWELPPATSLARLWADRDRRTEARALLAPIYAWFTEDFDTRDLQAARALLDALG
jgi:predicted ATPase